MDATCYTSAHNFAPGLIAIGPSALEEENQEAASLGFGCIYELPRLKGISYLRQADEGAQQTRIGAQKNQRQDMTVYVTVFCVILLIVQALTTYLAAFPSQLAERQMSGAMLLKPFSGGFSITTPARIADAAADGAQVDLLYGGLESMSPATIAAMQARHMIVIDGSITSYLYAFECHRLKTCPVSTAPALTSVSAVLMAVSKHLQSVRTRAMVAGYWVLDDWPSSDPGGARTLLIAIHQLIQRYTPRRPAICGFGGALYPGGLAQSGWSDLTANNFTPEACDMVGIYLYAASTTTKGSYDWSMRALLPAVLTSLRKRGWDIRNEPLIGIPQAFGGVLEGRSWPIPSAADIVAQSQAYCERGATGVLYYAWADSGATAQSIFPWNSAEVTRGIRHGITACKQIWAAKG